MKLFPLSALAILNFSVRRLCRRAEKFKMSSDKAAIGAMVADLKTIHQHKPSIKNIQKTFHSEPNILLEKSIDQQYIKSNSMPMNSYRSSKFLLIRYPNLLFLASPIFCFL